MNMFVSYKWLQDYVDLTGVTADELAEKITKSGIEVEGVEVLNEGIKNVVLVMSLNARTIQIQITCTNAW